VPLVNVLPLPDVRELAQTRIGILNPPDVTRLRKEVLRWNE